MKIYNCHDRLKDCLLKALKLPLKGNLSSFLDPEIDLLWMEMDIMMDYGLYFQDRLVGS
jgi:hypothetical protein